MSEQENKPTGGEPDPVPNLPEPTLDDAAISPDAAKDASLDEAAAEAARVEAEAKSAVSEPTETSWLNSKESNNWDDAFDSIGTADRAQSAKDPAELDGPAVVAPEPTPPAGQTSAQEHPPESTVTATTATAAESVGADPAAQIPASPEPTPQGSAVPESGVPTPATQQPAAPAAQPNQPWNPASAGATSTYAAAQGLAEQSTPAAAAAGTPQNSTPAAPAANWAQQPGGGPNQQVPPGPAGPFGPSGTQGPSGPQGPGDNQGKNNGKVWIFVIGGVVVLALIALLIWILMNLLNGNQNRDDAASSNSALSSSSSDAATPQSSSTDGAPIQANASPASWKVGDCISGYVDINTSADLVNCTTGHSGQLIGTFSYASSDGFPGEEALKTKGDEYCASIELTASASNYDIRQQFGYPTESTWGKGDRRIDCIAYTKGGEIIKESLIK